jgi:4'-phosphopantetheinyl transferase EntD
MRSAGDPSLLFPAEADCVGHAIPKRAADFAAGRLCARLALAEFGVVGFPLLVAGDRQPMWPSSLVGSITHTVGLCAAVVADRSTTAAIGIDCEVVQRVSADISSEVCGAAETIWIRSLPAEERAAGLALLFTAKEAFYKCQYPMTTEWLDFHDVRITPLNWGLPRSSFEVHSTRPIALDPRISHPLIGHYLFHGGFVTAGLSVPIFP